MWDLVAETGCFYTGAVGRPLTKKNRPLDMTTFKTLALPQTYGYCA
jgi:hypothetical protein